MVISETRPHLSADSASNSHANSNAPDGKGMWRIGAHSGQGL